MELKNYRLKSLDDIKYPRLCDIWNTGVSFVIPSKSELMKRVAIQKTPRFKVMIHLFCTDGIERGLDFDTLRNYVIECDEHLNKTGNIVTPCTKFYKKCSMTKSARELFELIAGYCGHTIKVIDVKHVYTNYHNSLITRCLPCFEVID